VLRLRVSWGETMRDAPSRGSRRSGAVSEPHGSEQGSWEKLAGLPRLEEEVLGVTARFGGSLRFPVASTSLVMQLLRTISLGERRRADPQRVHLF